MDRDAILAELLEIEGMLLETGSVTRTVTPCTGHRRRCGTGCRDMATGVADVLSRRWPPCRGCIRAGALSAATTMQKAPRFGLQLKGSTTVGSVCP
jgi:hypothetical protein